MHRSSKPTKRWKSSWHLPEDLAPTIRVASKQKCPDPFGRAFAARLDGPLLRPTFEYAPPTDQKRVAAKNADYYCARGFAQRSREDYRAALAEYQQALRLDPKHYNTYINRGVAWDKLSRSNNAVSSFSKAIECADSKSDVAYARFNRGCCLGAMGNWERALEDFGMALEHDQSNENFRFNHAFALRKLGRFGEAVEDYQLTRALKSEEFSKCFNRAGSHGRSTAQFRKQLSEEAMKHVEPDEQHSDKASALKKMMSQDTETQRLESDCQLDDSIKTILDMPAEHRTDLELSSLQEALRRAHMLDSIHVSEFTFLEMLRVMYLLTAESRSFLYHESQVNPDLYVMLSGQVMLLATPPERSSQDELMTSGAAFGNLNIESLQAPQSKKTALVEKRSELLVINTKDLHTSIKKHHAGWIAEKQRFLASSMLFRHWSRAKLYETALQFVEKVYQAGEVVLLQGQEVQGLWIIKSGQCRVTRRLQYTQHQSMIDADVPESAVHTAEVELRDMWKREYLGEVCLLSHTQGSADECLHHECITAVTPVVMLFINAADAHKLICKDNMTMKLLGQALTPPPQDSLLLDSLFSNQSWSKFKDTIQTKLQSTSIENIYIDDSFPSLPTKPPKATAAEKPYQTNMHSWMKEHREFWDIERKH